MNTVSTDFSAQDAQTNVSNTPHTLPNISFATHNVRSFTNIAKQNSLVALYSSLNLDIIGLQETNFSSHSHSTFNRTFSNKFTGFFGSSSTSQLQKSGFGVGLLLRPHLANHVFHHESKDNRIILVDLQFANKQKLRIINCYPPPGNYNVRKQIHTNLMKYLRDAYSNNYHLVLLGDLNADMDNPKLHSQDKRFFSNLNDMNLFDTFSVKYDAHRSDYPTHQGPISSSRIDYIWSSVDVISNLVGCETIQITSDLTDHSIVILYIDNFLDVSSNIGIFP